MQLKIQLRIAAEIGMLACRVTKLDDLESVGRQRAPRDGAELLETLAIDKLFGRCF